MRAHRPAHGVESIGATVLWVMRALGPRPSVFGGITPMEERISAYYVRGMGPIPEVCRRAYLRGKRAGS